MKSDRVHCRPVPGIYEIVNGITGRRYIGSAVNLRKRLVSHLRLLRQGRHYNSSLQGAWNKSGGESFTFRPLMFCTRGDLRSFEQSVLDYWNRTDWKLLYNFAHDALAPMTGVPSPMTGRTHTPESRLKMSISNRGRQKSAEHRAKIGAAHVGMKRSPETCARISAALRGKAAHNRKDRYTPKMF